MADSALANDKLIGHSFDDYRIIDVVGRGGMGTVYRAWDEVLRRDVALKVMLAEADRRARERFLREAQFAAKLDHENIVRVYRGGSDEGYLYLAMEFIEGQSLRALLGHNGGGVPVPQALSIAHQLLSALSAAHENNIVHRDIKPENILLRQEGGVKILDFGVAKVQNEAFLTRADEILGTVEYMAPEQILGEELGPAVDLYAVGAVLYELLVGRLPFSGDSPATLVYHQLNEDPQPPSFHNPAVPTSLDRLVLQLLEKLPEDRFASADEALSDLLDVQRRQAMGEISDLEVEQDGEKQRGLRSREFRPRFTGRRAELGILTRNFDDLAGGGSVVFLAGEAGVGKSRVLEELARYAADNDGRLVKGMCFYEHGFGPYMPFLDAVGNLLEGASDGERKTLKGILAEQAPELAELASSSRTTAKIRASFTAAFGSESDPDAARQRFFDTVYDLFAVAAETRRLVVCFEDMQWADEGSVQLLNYMARRISESRILSVVTYRPEDLETESRDATSLLTLVQQLDSEGLLRELRLERLDRKDLTRLVNSLFYDADFTADFIDLLLEQTQGNPFIAVEVMKFLRDQGHLRYESGVWSVRAELRELGIPDRVKALVLRRIEPLDVAERELIQVAAVAGHRFSSSTLEATTGMSKIDALKSLFRLEKKSRLIVSVGDGFEFSHSKIREVLYEEIPWELRREYHRMVGSALSERTSKGGEICDADELGTHFYHAQDFPRAISYLTQAGDDAFELFTWRKASSYYDQVIESCNHVGGQTDALLHALRRSAIANVYLTAYDKARERCNQMRELAHQEGRPLDEAEALKVTGKVDEHQRRFPHAVEVYEKAMICLEGQDAPVARAKILINWGVADFECGRYEDAESRWKEVVELAADENRQERAEALNNLAVVATLQGDLDKAWNLYEEVLQLDEQLKPSPQTPLTFYNMGMLRADQERWDEALELYDRSLESCRAARFAFHEPVIELNRTEALMGKGNLVEARKACGTALRGLRRLQDSLGVADALRMYGRLCRIEGNWQDSRTYLEKSIEMNRDFGESVSLAEALFELGLLERDAGDADASLSQLREAERIFEQAEATPDLDSVRAVIAELKPAAKSA